MIAATSSGAAYATNIEHLQHELRRIDLLIEYAVNEFRTAQLEEQHNDKRLYISDAEVDALLNGSYPMTPGCGSGSCAPASSSPPTDLYVMTNDIARRAEATRSAGVPLRLPRLAERFGLTAFDVNALLICLAPELDRKYERLYAYLQDDLTKRRPTVDLVLNLLCSSRDLKMAARNRFACTSPLVGRLVLQILEDPSQVEAPLLTRALKVQDRIVGFLLGSDAPETRLQPYARYVTPATRIQDLVLPGELKDRLLQLVVQGQKSSSSVLLHLDGPYGAGKRLAAEAVCQAAGLSLLVMDGAKIASGVQGEFPEVVKLAAREAALTGAAVYWDRCETLLGMDPAGRDEILACMLQGSTPYAFLASRGGWNASPALRQLPYIHITLPAPPAAERRQLWARALEQCAAQVGAAEVAEVASRFRLTGGQIQDAVATAKNLARWRSPEAPVISMAELFEASRLQSSHALDTLALKIEPCYSWQDIILPADELRQLHDICDVFRYHELVYEAWGFDRKVSGCTALNVLFAGPSGTGKTMAAEIIANDLGLDLYKIDLSAVVSKYIGDTEKNLARIFDAAESSNAILFFDEADALFGKRSEVKDAHDRYANIEISFLLQQMERHKSMAILATNMRRNIDEAFARRLAFSVSFPFPDETQRLRIWEHVWPAETPLDEQLDFEFMARQFKIAGASIRNIALAAAFAAAADSGLVKMEHLILATRRELEKLGKVCVAADFGRYHAQVSLNSTYRQDSA